MSKYSAISFILFALLSIASYSTVECVRCYICASSEDPKGIDNCGAYRKFDKEENIAVECNTDDSPMPGSFCVKIVQQGPVGFIWDGRWRQVIRRCASVADTGVTGVCNWGVYENGDYWEECYCSSDECNHSSRFSVSKGLIILTSVLALISSLKAIAQF